MISAITVERTWQRMAQSEINDVPRLIEELQEKQPFLQAYMLAVGDANFDQEISQLFFYLGVVVYQIMKQGKRRIRFVSEEIMNAVEEEKQEALELLEGDTDADFVSAVENMLAEYPEPEVLRYIVEAIMEEDGDDDLEIPEEDKGILFLELKTVLDALILSRDWNLRRKQQV
ncbi:hypothetical protein KFU94_63745 [Chloroflexi bacterium TSY]|nr:hypothetical protein [Chloroflexi bacterium TSY]